MGKLKKRINYVKINDKPGTVFHVENRLRKPPKEKESNPESLNPKVKPRQKQSGSAAKLSEKTYTIRTNVPQKAARITELDERNKNRKTKGKRMTNVSKKKR